LPHLGGTPLVWVCFPFLVMVIERLMESLPPPPPAFKDPDFTAGFRTPVSALPACEMVQTAPCRKSGGRVFSLLLASTSFHHCFFPPTNQILLHKPGSLVFCSPPFFFVVFSCLTRNCAWSAVPPPCWFFLLGEQRFSFLVVAHELYCAWRTSRFADCSGQPN